MKTDKQSSIAETIIITIYNSLHQYIKPLVYDKEFQRGEILYKTFNEKVGG